MLVNHELVSELALWLRIRVLQMAEGGIVMMHHVSSLDQFLASLPVNHLLVIRCIHLLHASRVESIFSRNPVSIILLLYKVHELTPQSSDSITKHTDLLQKQSFFL